MSFAQHYVVTFLEAEVFHSLGSYRPASEAFHLIEKDLETRGDRDRREAKQALNPEFLSLSRRYNWELHDKIHQATSDSRHPSPRIIPSSFGTFPLAAGEGHHSWIPEFYEAGIAALDTGADSELTQFLMFEGTQAKRLTDEHRRGKHHRFQSRLKYARALSLSPIRPGAEVKKLLLQDCLGEGGGAQGPHHYILAALTDAHMRMHHAEHLKSANFAGTMSSRNEEECSQLLWLSIVINTFVFAICRSAPWVFAEDGAERDLVQGKYEECRSNLTPPRCLWAAQLASFLALYRRAYAYALLGRKLKAFNDYHKVQRLMRVAGRALERAAMRIENSLQLMAALDAVSEYHIGELYRSDHAHTRAFDHYRRSFERLEVLRTEAAGANPQHHRVLAAASRIPLSEVVDLSRWRIELLLSVGKAFYELGQPKRALEWHTRAWQAFLLVTARDSEMDLNTSVAHEVEAWLSSVRNDPDISKQELARHFLRLGRELASVRVSRRLEGLAADILNRIGHTLFVLRLGKEQGAPRGADGSAESMPNEGDTIAFVFVSLAHKLDPYSTLVRSNLLTIQQRSPSLRSTLDPLAVTQQWPSGGGEFERFARAYEHHLLQQLARTRSARKRGTTALATSLLAQFLNHTENIDVKLSQVYKYLMAPGTDGFPRLDKGGALELVCLRRYSSFFPFLPRPSAFRALGGGYLLRVHENSKELPFGIAIDPGANFIENLYRCGLTLADVDMVIVSHDHADHMTSLDPLLSLLGYRMTLGDRKFGREGASGRLVILGNASVVERYQFFNRQSRRRDAVRVAGIDEWGSLAGVEGLHTPRHAELAITSVSGLHVDLAGHHSNGFRISLGAAGPSIGFTSDTGAFYLSHGKIVDAGKTKNGQAWSQHWREVLNVDVVVPHLSSVPLPQLRQLAGLDVEDSELQRIYERMSEPARRQVEFAFRPSGSKLVGKAPGTYKPSSKHLYLAGLLAFADTFRKTKGRRGLLVIGELREELATFRTKIASEINRHVFDERGDRHLRALTGDLGLRVLIDSTGPRVLCSTCDLDNDYTEDERFHLADEIREVCIKGEHEGIFYNCRAHDPASQPDPVFVERMESYDVFGHTTFP